MPFIIKSPFWQKHPTTTVAFQLHKPKDEPVYLLKRGAPIHQVPYEAEDTLWFCGHKMTLLEEFVED